MKYQCLRLLFLKPDRVTSVRLSGVLLSLAEDTKIAFDIRCFVIVIRLILYYRYIRSAWKRVLEAAVIAAITACVSFNLIYYYDVCQPNGVNNISKPLQVFLKIILHFSVVVYLLKNLPFLCFALECVG